MRAAETLLTATTGCRRAAKISGVQHLSGIYFPQTAAELEKPEAGDWEEAHPAGGDDGVLEDAAAQLAAQLDRRLLCKHLRLLRQRQTRSIREAAAERERGLPFLQSYRVLLLLVQRERGAKGHVGLGVQGSHGDGGVGSSGSADGRLRMKKASRGV